MKREQRKAAKAHKKIEPQPRDWSRLTAHAPLLGVILIALIAYSNSFYAPFLLDNDEAILRDTRVHAATPENVSRILSSPYNETLLSGLYRPVTTLSYLFNYAVLGSGSAPGGYHWINFLLHAINIALVYALALALFEDRTAALAASALWGLHPVLTESVTNIVGRADELAALGVLSCLLCYRAAVLSDGVRRAAWTLGVALTAGVAVWSKEAGVVVLPALLLFDLAFLRDRPGRVRGIALGAAALPAVVFFAVRAGVLGHFPAAPYPFTDNPLVAADFWTARVTTFKVIAKEIGLLLWPAKLSADYSYAEITATRGVAGYFGLALCVAIGALALWAWRQHKPLFFAIVFFFLALAPTSNIFLIIGSIMGERFLYLPAVGFVLAIVYGLKRIADRGAQARKAVAVALGVILLAAVVRANSRNGDWTEAQRFWTTVADAAPGSYKGHISLAANLPMLRRADRERVAAEVAKTLAILDPLPDLQNAPIAYRMAGSIYRRMGDEVALHRAEPDGTQPNDWYQKALTVLSRGEALELARDQQYRELNARRGTPRSSFLGSAIYFEIGRTYLRMAQQLQAVSFYEKGRSLEPNADLLEDEAATLASFGDYRKAAQAYIEALEVDGSRQDLTQNIVEMYRKLDPNGCAAASGALNVQCPMVHSDICGAAQNVENTYMRRGQPEDAAAVRRVAIIDLGCTGVGGK